MNEGILGLHHITAIAGNAQKNYEFYTSILGQRLVKKTVNFDDPETYHLYYGNRIGSPGTVITFFPWQGISPGTNGGGMATEISYSIPSASIRFWRERLKSFGISIGDLLSAFGQQYFSFPDPDGLHLRLVGDDAMIGTMGFAEAQLPAEHSIRGFHSTGLSLKSIKATERILTELLGYSLSAEGGNRSRYTSPNSDRVSHIELIRNNDPAIGHLGAGSIHHVAFRVRDEMTLMHYRDEILKMGISVTPKIDRDYFFSIYFREPGGVLFELATDNPGFLIDETLENLGTSLQLPEKFEHTRSTIEKKLPKLT